MEFPFPATGGEDTSGLINPKHSPPPFAPVRRAVPYSGPKAQRQI